MQEKQIKLETEVPREHYRAWYRCSNCGVVFQFDMRKADPIANMKGVCPHCGVKSGTAGVGVFPIIKYNPKHDEIQRHYFR
jgi:DNA-directed RNA polymerase subunit RPC12/RpoP